MATPPVDTHAVLAAYLAAEYAEALQRRMTAADLEALASLRQVCAEVRMPLIRELAEVGNQAQAGAAAGIVSSLLEHPTSPGRAVTATELCAEMGRAWARGNGTLQFLQLLRVFINGLPVDAAARLGEWLGDVSRMRRNRRLSRAILVGAAAAVGAGVLAAARLLPR